VFRQANAKSVKGLKNAVLCSIPDASLRIKNNQPRKRQSDAKRRHFLVAM